jgi:hypothetical protein
MGDFIWNFTAGSVLVLMINESSSVGGIYGQEKADGSSWLAEIDVYVG